MSKHALRLAVVCVLGIARPPSVAHAAPATLMVLYFDNNTGNKDYDHLAKGLADMMITDLSAVPSLQVVERDKLEAILKELKLQRSKYFDPQTAQKLGKGVGASFAVAGAFVSVEPNLRLDVRVIKIQDGKVVKSAAVTGEQRKFFELQQQLTTQLIDGLSTVLSAGDAEKARRSANTNRVDSLETVNDYAKALDARDNGDLAGASQYLQKVVSSSPEFKLGKTRYMQIMKDLYSAKSTRATLLNDNETRLLQSIDQQLAHGSAASSSKVLAYRVLLGQYHLTKVAEAFQKPAAAYRDHLRAWVDNQLKLMAETRDLQEYPMSSSLPAEDVKLAEEIGIKQPGSTFGNGSPQELMRRFAAVLMFGEPSTFEANISPTERICYYKLDPNYPRYALTALDHALTHIEKYERRYQARESMRTLQQYAKSLSALGRDEEAIAKLQSGLTKYPKSDEFKDVEELLRSTLEGKKSGWQCHAPR